MLFTCKTVQQAIIHCILWVYDRFKFFLNKCDDRQKNIVFNFLYYLSLQFQCRTCKKFSFCHLLPFNREKKRFVANEETFSNQWWQNLTCEFLNIERFHFVSWNIDHYLRQAFLYIQYIALHFLFFLLLFSFPL